MDPDPVPAAAYFKTGNEALPSNATGIRRTGDEIRAREWGAHLRFLCSVEVLEEGAKAIGWDKRNPKPGGNPGRFKRGIGVACRSTMPDTWVTTTAKMASRRLTAARPAAGWRPTVFSTELELTADGYVTMKKRFPTAARTRHRDGYAGRRNARVHDPGSHPRGMGRHGPRTPKRVHGLPARPSRCKAAPSAARPTSSERIFCSAQPMLLKVDVAKLQIRDGVISSTEDPQKENNVCGAGQSEQGSHPPTGGA